MTKSVIIATAVTSALMVPTMVWASDAPWDRGMDQARAVRDASSSQPWQVSLDTSIVPKAEATGAAGQNGAADTDSSQSPPVVTLDATSPPSRIHGFGDFRISNAYITPRGLLVSNSGVHFQPLLGLVFDVYQGTGPVNDVSLIFGTWGDFTSSHPNGDIWTEQDFFAGFDVKFLDKFDFAYSIMAWTFPDVSVTNEANPTTEYNMDFKLSFNDSDYLKDFALHPYVDLFWNFAGDSSPVVADALMGTNDHTFYIEVGVGPSYTFKAIEDLPITFTFPTYFSFGDSSFWGETPSGERSNLGVFSTGVKASVPLKFIAPEFGSWNAYVGVTYIHTCNPALSYVNENILSNGDSSNLVYGYAGVGFGF